MSGHRSYAFFGRGEKTTSYRQVVRRSYGEWWWGGSSANAWDETQLELPMYYAPEIWHGSCRACPAEPNPCTPFQTACAQSGGNQQRRERERARYIETKTSEGKGGASVSESSVSRNTNFGLQRGLNRRRHPYRSVSRDTRSDFASAGTVPRTAP